MEKKQTVNVIGLIACAAILISAFLPYMTASLLGISYSMTIMEMKEVLGIGIAVLGVIGAVFAAKRVRIGSILIGVIGIIAIFLIGQHAKAELNQPYVGEIAKGILKNDAGFYCLLCGSVGSVLSFFIG